MVFSFMSMRSVREYFWFNGKPTAAVESTGPISGNQSLPKTHSSSESSCFFPGNTYVRRRKSYPGLKSVGTQKLRFFILFFNARVSGVSIFPSTTCFPFNLAGRVTFFPNVKNGVVRKLDVEGI
nr:hypothetical protein 2 [signal crayfish associated picorna-like virus 7]